MGAYLDVNEPAVRQWYDERNKPLTGCTVLHSAESVADFVGPDTGAEAVARFIQNRTTAGSYHDLTDFDSGITLVDYIHGAFHDATGSNNWALSLSFALRTTDWARMTPERRRGFLWQGAYKFVQQQLWRAKVGAPLTRVRLITKAQSDAGESGFTYHGYRDPGRRSDPGVKAPNLFPFAEFAEACRQALADFMPSHPDAARRGPQVKGAIRQAYDRVVINNARWSFFIGAPLGDEALTWGKDGYWQQFERGAIYAHAGGSFVLWGSILKRFWELGSEAQFGYPVTDELTCPDGVGKMSHFRGGPHGDASIYWTPTTKAHPVWGWFRRDWAASGFERGPWGYPTSAERKLDGGAVVQDFQRGQVSIRDGKVTFQPR